jgi:hypothetical protein
MAHMPADEAALVVRVWREPGVAGFRGRVVHRTSAGEVAETVVTFDSADRLHAAVQEWLDEFLSADRHPPAQTR